MVTGYPNYPQGVIYPGYKQKIVGIEKLDEVKVIRVPLYPDRSRSVVKRSLNYLSFSSTASLIGPLLCGRCDLIFVYSPPITLGIPLWITGHLRKAPAVLEIQDMWPETLQATGMVSNKLVLKLLGKIGMLSYDYARAITVISPGFKKNLIEKGVDAQKIHIIYNWAYEENYPLQQKDRLLAEKVGMKDRFNILYAGNIGPAQGLSNVIETAARLADIGDLQFILMGDGLEREELEETVRIKNLTNVKFLSPQPMSRMPTFYALADALIVHLTQDPLFDITVPGKTQSCLLAGRPIIASVNGDAADLVLRAQAGLAARAMDPGDLERAVRELYAMPRERRETMGSNGRAYYFQNLCPDIQIEKYERLFQQLASKSC